MATSNVPSELKKLARTYYVRNAAMNLEKRESEAARKALFAAMIQGEIEPFDFDTKDAEGKKIRLSVATAANEVTVMDVAKLRELVDEETFLKIVSATKKAIEETAGKNIAVLCERKMPGVPNVFVKTAA